MDTDRLEVFSENEIFPCTFLAYHAVAAKIIDQFKIRKWIIYWNAVRKFVI